MAHRTRVPPACLVSLHLRGYCGPQPARLEIPTPIQPRSPAMNAIFRPEGPLFRATEQAGGPWSPDMLQGSATTALMTREIERLGNASGFAVRPLTLDLC